MRIALLSKTLPLAVALFAVHLAHFFLCMVAGAIARRDGAIAVMLYGTLLVAASIAVGLAVRRAQHRGWLAAILIASLCAKYAVQLERHRVHGDPLPSLGLHAPMSTEVERFPGRPRVVYRFNDRGFRG